MRKKLTLGRSIDILIVTSIYISCLFNQEPIPLTFIAQKCKISRVKISRVYRSLRDELDLKIPPPDLYKFLTFFLNKLNLPNDLFETAKSLISQILEKNIDQGKDPSSIIGAVIYIAGKIKGKLCTQRTICKTLRISAVTIRLRSKEIKEGLKIYFK